MTGGSLTHAELVVACKNIGFDLSCGACAALFYTGVGLPYDEHSESCDSHKVERAFAETIDNVREALGLKATHYLIIADDVREIVEAVEKGGDAKSVLNRIRERMST